MGMTQIKKPGFFPAWEEAVCSGKADFFPPCTVAKKRHTVKNTVISTVDKVILFIGQIFTRYNHDYTERGITLV